jgi:hypothetical protein
VLAVAVALVVGLGVGWLLGKSQPSEAEAEEVAPAGSASGGVAEQCKTWSETICKETSDDSAACSQAKAAADLLPAGVCNVALKQVPATLEQVKATRAVCDQLVTKLCTDLGDASETCKMVKTKTASFPPAQCREMLKNYDQVLGQLKRIGQQRMMAPGMPPGASPHGASPHGAMPPGAMPRGPSPGGPKPAPAPAPAPATGPQ